MNENDMLRSVENRTAIVVKAARLVASEPALQGWPVVVKLRTAVQGLDIAMASSARRVPRRCPMTWRRALACLLIVVFVAVKAEGARLRRVCAPNGPRGRWSR